MVTATLSLLLIATEVVLMCSQAVSMILEAN